MPCFQEVPVRAMGRTLLRHMGAMVGDTEVPPVVLEVTNNTFVLDTIDLLL